MKTRLNSLLCCLLLFVSAAGCDKPPVETSNAEPEWVRRANRLYPEARRVVCDWWGKPVELQLVPVASLSYGVAKRDSGKLLITAAAAETDVECFDTLTHELLHEAFNAQTTWSGDCDVRVIRVQAAVNEALAWRFAAELTADYYGLPVAYRWEFVPACMFSRELIVSLVQDRPEAMLAIAQDYATAKAFVDGVSRVAKAP